MFKPAKRAGLTPVDLARIVGVSRATVSLWWNGHRNPHILLADKMKTVMAAIEAAVEAGDLPLKETRLPAVERTRLIAAALAKHTPAA